MNVGENIKRERIKKGLTQKQLGELCGMADSAIRRYENGRANPKIETLEKIANSLGVAVSDLRDDLSTFKNSIISDSPLLTAALKTGGKDDWLFKEHLQRTIIQKLDMTDDKQKLIIDYNKLNATGQQEAVRQVELLTKIPEYRKDTTPEDI